MNTDTSTRHDGQAPFLPDGDRVRSLAEALIEIGKRWSAKALLPDALKAAVVEHSPHVGYWNLDGSDARMLGLIQNEPAIKSQCREKDVMVWATGSAERAEIRRVLIVNAEWCTSPGDKFQHVNEPHRGRGAHCRFCGLEEEVISNLVELGGSRPATPTLINRMPALRPGSVFLHADVRDEHGQVIEPRCESEWLRWCEIATKYATRQPKRIAGVRS